jgi:hypothetical protein
MGTRHLAAFQPVVSLLYQYIWMGLICAEYVWNMVAWYDAHHENESKHYNQEYRYGFQQCT